MAAARPDEHASIVTIHHNAHYQLGDINPESQCIIQHVKFLVRQHSAPPLPRGEQHASFLAHGKLMLDSAV